MLTEEQIQNLKKGDKLLAEVSFISVNKDNDLECRAPATTIGGDVMESNDYYHPSCLSLPPAKPKYNPCRKFRKGDKVRVVEYKGRNYTNVDTGKEGVVSRNETGADPAIEVTFGDDDFWDVDPAYLELVTPVEEQKIFFYENEPELPYYCVHFGRPNNFEFVAHLDKEHYSKKQVQAECDRLNAAYRKNQP